MLVNYTIDIRDEDLEYADFKGRSKEEEKMIKDVKVALFNNLAACYLKLEDYTNAIAACNEVLVLEPSQAKAWLECSFDFHKYLIGFGVPKRPFHQVMQDFKSIARLETT